MANRIVDLAAAQLYPEDAPHRYVPFAVEGDGNCLFCSPSVLVLVYGDQGLQA